MYGLYINNLWSCQRRFPASVLCPFHGFLVGAPSFQRFWVIYKATLKGNSQDQVISFPSSLYYFWVIHSKRTKDPLALSCSFFLLESASLLAKTWCKLYPPFGNYSLSALFNQWRCFFHKIKGINPNILSPSDFLVSKKRKKVHHIKRPSIRRDDEDIRKLKK